MQRWWFGDSDKAKDAQVAKTTIVDRSAERRHTFRVLVNQPLLACEAIAITGECASLGNWLPQQCIALEREKGR